MGIFQKLRMAAALPELAASYVNPAIASPWAPQPAHLNSVVWPDITGMKYLPITRLEAMSVPAMARARGLICGTLGNLPLREYTHDGKVTDDQPDFLTRTDRGISPFHRMLWTADDLLFFGWSLWSADERDETGRVTSAQRIPFDFWDFNSKFEVTINGETAAADEVILIPGIHEGLLQFAGRTLRHSTHLLDAADKAAETPMANVELHQTSGAPMNDDDISKLVSRWAAARRGENGGVGYTNSAIEVKEHGALNEHLLIKGRNAAAVDVARVAGIPAVLLDAGAEGGDSMSYDNAQGRNAELVDYGLRPLMAAIAGRLSLTDVTPADRRISFDLEEFIGPSPLSVNTDTPAPDRSGPGHSQADRVSVEKEEVPS